MKRLFDFFVASILLLVCLPLVLVLVIAIVVVSPGNPFFGQDRVGRYGQVFRLWKLRSMVPKAESRGTHYTQNNDPRITSIGRILRKTSMDELPQLWNVIRGDMSLVGPRPSLPRQEAEYTASDWKKRYQVRPGITGLAQIKGRSSLQLNEQVAYDLQYVDSQQFLLDMRILFDTIWLVLVRKKTN